MKLTVDDLISAIQSARDIEKLQAELRTAMIDRLMEQSTTQQARVLAPVISGAPNIELC